MVSRGVRHPASERCLMVAFQRPINNDLAEAAWVS